MLDVAVIGGGPAGLSAAVNARARGKSVAVFGRDPEMSALWKAARIDNHLGMHGMSGSQMMEEFLRHATDAGAQIRNGRVSRVMPSGDGFMLNFSPSLNPRENEFIEAKTVILCVGAGSGSKIPGEERFLGNGVSYCATCDGMLYRGRDVCLVAEDEEALSDVLFLADICKTVYLVNKIGLKTDDLPDNVIKADGKVTEVFGEDYADSVKVGDSTLNVDCVFFIKPVFPVASLIYGLETNPDGSIATNTMMETNISGVFACGDARGKPFQLSKAIGDGQTAALRAAELVTLK